MSPVLHSPPVAFGKPHSCQPKHELDAEQRFDKSRQKDDYATSAKRVLSGKLERGRKTHRPSSFRLAGSWRTDSFVLRSKLAVGKTWIFVARCDWQGTTLKVIQMQAMLHHEDGKRDEAQRTPPEAGLAPSTRTPEAGKKLKRQRQEETEKQFWPEERLVTYPPAMPPPSGAPRWEYTETLREVAMDKPRHPQVIRPWKTQQTQKNKWSPPPLREPQRERGKKLHSPRRG